MKLSPNDLTKLFDALPNGILSGDEYETTCPAHDDSKPSFRFNVAKGVGYCHACHYRCNVKSLGRLLNIQFDNTEWVGDELELLPMQIKQVLDKKESTQHVYDESYLNRFKFQTDYWHSRNLEDHIIEKFQLGYDPLVNAATIPMRDINGNLLGVTYRYLDDADRKYKYPHGFHRNHHLFGSWEFDQTNSKTAILVEGAIDCMKVWQAGYTALAQYGSTLSQEQQHVLLMLGVERVILMFDNDKAGRKATQHCYGLTSSGRYDPLTDLTRRFVVSRMVWRPGLSDPGSTDTTTIKEMIEDTY